MNNIAFMHAAYVVVWIILGGYSADLVARWRSLERELRDFKSAPPSADSALAGGSGRKK